MSGETEALVAEAQDALEAGEWSTARAAFEAALAREESAEARFGLGNALWWLGETEASVRCQERAYAAFRRRPDPAQAALVAISLSLTYRASLGNHAASQGWLGRAARLVEEFELGPLNGWVLLCRAVAANDGQDPSAAERWAREAHDIAARSADGDLELCALSELGAALVEMGRVEDGTALLDEAMAGSLGGETESLDTVVMTSCNTIVCCSRAADFKRAAQWIRAADDFNRRYGSPHLYTVCRTAYGSILFATGDWARAETELLAALEIGRSAEPGLHAGALAKLAELRLAQGRPEEAAALLAGFEDHPAAACVVGALHLARGEPAVATSILVRRLRDVSEQCLERAALLELLVEAEIEQGTAAVTATAPRQLAELRARLSSDPIVAPAERGLGRALLAGDDAERAIAHLEQALAAFRRIEMPLEVARTRLLLATALVRAEPETAIAEARAALACFEELGAGRDADATAAFLRRLGVKAARSGPKRIGLLTKRELEVLALLGQGLSNGAIAERLFITRKTVEHHVGRVLSKLELSGRGEATAYALRNLARERDSATK